MCVRVTNDSTRIFTYIVVVIGNHSRSMYACAIMRVVCACVLDRMVTTLGATLRSRYLGGATKAFDLPKIDH